MPLTAETIWRDYVTAGVPGSGEHEPDKAEIRAHLTALEAKNNAVTRVRVVATSNVDIAGGGLAAGTTHDGVTLAENDTVLLTAQTASEENGVYIVPASGAASRSASFNAYDNIAGTLFTVMEGTVNADTLWRCTSNKGGTIDTTAIALEEFTSGTVNVATRTALKALDTTKHTVALLTESGREGAFVWRAGDYSTEIAADTEEGIYVKADAIASSSGAWVRSAGFYVEGLHVNWFGAATSASSSTNATAINAAISLANTLGVGRVRVGAGTYEVSNVGASFYAIEMKSNVHLDGQGMFVSTLKLAAGESDCHVIDMPGVSGTPVQKARISNLGVDGNRSNVSGSGHGIRGAWLTDVVIDRVFVQNTLVYGIGFQDGQIAEVEVNSTIIKSTGQDGIDFKNKDNSNYGNSVNDCLVIDPGMSQTNKAAYDLRGPVTVTNVQAWFLTTTNSPDGIRFRQDDASAGLGAHRSVLTGFHIGIDGGTCNAALSVVADNVSISNGTVKGAAARGAKIETGISNTALSNVLAQDCVAAFEDAGTNTEFIGCRALDASGEGYRINAATNGRLIGCISKGNNYGFREVNSPTGMIYIGSEAASNTTSDWAVGADSQVIGAAGYTGALRLFDGNGVAQAELGTTANTVNRVRLNGAATGGNPSLQAVGDDTNMDLTLSAKGTGVVRYGSHSALSGETVTGYITIKDEGGTVRKLAVVS